MDTQLEVDGETEIRPISHESTNDAAFRLVAPLLTPESRVLDLGAGAGYFSRKLGDHIATALGADPAGALAACDVTPEIFRYARVACDAIAPDGTLPYEAESFDVVCSIEVIEHVEDQFRFCREILRVLKPGGVAIVTTPNVLNLNSRVRILHSGFATLFDPLSLSEVDVVHTSGHIHPIGYYYLAYALTRAGAREVSVAFDRLKSSARALQVVLWPVLALGNLGFRARMRRKRPEVLAQNAALLRACWCSEMLLARSIVVRAVK